MVDKNGVILTGVGGGGVVVEQTSQRIGGVGLVVYRGLCGIGGGRGGQYEACCCNGIVARYNSLWLQLIIWTN